MAVQVDQRNLQILQWNARSIENKMFDLDVTQRTAKPHVITIQETFLNETVTTPKLSNYTPYRKDRDNGEKRGGLLIYVRDQVNHIQKNLVPYPNGTIEALAITIKSNQENLDILNIYNPKGNNMSKQELLHYKTQLNEKYFIVGDFNSHNSLWEPTNNPRTNNSGKAIQEIINENNDIALITPPDLPTHVDDRTGETSTIDLQFCSPHYIGLSDVLTLGDIGSDHTPLLITVAVKADISIRGKRPNWIFLETKWNTWLSNLEEISPYEPNEDLAEEIKHFTDTLNLAGERTFKKSSSKVKEKKNKYWWDQNCARATALRRRARRKMERYPSRPNIMNYRRLTAAAIKVHKLAKRLAWRKYVSRITPKTSSKEIWGIIRSFKGLQKVNNSPLLVNNALIFDTQDKSNIIAKHLQSCMYRREAYNYLHEDIQLIDRTANGMQDEAYNSRFTLHELNDAIEALNPDKACGSDEIHNQFLLHLPWYLRNQLPGIFNRIWRSGHFPDEWKLALVIPILKQNKNPQLPESYRPISLLSCLSKLMEKMVNDRLTYIVESRNKLRQTQFGFRIRRSCIDPIIAVEHEIRKGLYKKQFTVLVFFDLKSAFDLVDHIYLLKTLAEIGIGGNMLSFLISFLTDRKIQVLLEDKFSEIYEINCGVPQGSILSPLLFILLLTTLPVNIWPVSSKELADDIVFSVTADTIQLADMYMQDAIDRFSTWCKNLKLIINIQKTKCMCFTTKKDENFDPITPQLKLDGVDIESVSTYKYLGVILDAPYLTWKPHINMLKTDCMKRLNILRALAGTKWGADRENLLKINEALCRSKIAYGCQALLTASNSNLNTLQVIQNAALRTALGAWRSTNISALHAEANVVPLNLYIQQQGIKLYYKLKAQGPEHVVHNLIFDDRELMDREWTYIRKKPFVLKIEDILNQWGLPKDPEMKIIKYPTVYPWFDIEKYISHDLISHTTKKMGTIQNHQSTLETLNINYQGYIHIYTDGSKALDETTGAAFYVPERNFISKWRLHGESSIVSSELSAIEKATSWLLLQDPPGKSVILTDSNSSLHLIKHRKPKHFIVSIQHIQHNLIKLIENGWIIHFQWIPSHCGIRGNDVVDQAADNARLLEHITYLIELNDLYNLVKKKQKVIWQTQWDLVRPTTHLGLIKENLESWDWCRNTDRFLDVLMTRLRLGKAGLNKYLKKLERIDTDLCMKCNTGVVEDIYHYVIECQAYSIPRQRLNNTLISMSIPTMTLNLVLGSSQLEPAQKCRINDALAIFVTNTKRFED